MTKAHRQVWKKEIDKIDKLYPNRRGRACVFCEFWEGSTDADPEETGWCLRYPPAMLGVNKPEHVRTEADDWCGEYRPGANHP